METSLAALAAREEQEFLRVTATTLKILQNIQNEPSELKYRKLRITSAFCSKPGISDLMQALGFEKRGNYHVLDEAFVPSLSTKKQEIRAVRKKSSSILGWDVPFSMLKFTTALGACKYGEVFGGTLDEGEVVMKMLKPDGGEIWRESFDRELDLLYKLDHPNIVKLEAVTLTSDPTSIILECVPTSLLYVLNHSELGDEATASIALQVARGMAYLHSQTILHCDLGARNVRLTSTRVAKLCDFGLACREGSTSCTLTPERVGTLPLRWTAPEVLQQLLVTRAGDIWSYGVFLYELVTNGSVPYASFNNQQVRSKVIEGYRLPQPHNCPDELYSLMFQCWLLRAIERPNFDNVIHNHLDPLKVKACEGRLSRQNSTSTTEDDGKSSTLKSPRSGSTSGGGHKLKVKEPLYPQVLSKGGGLLRVYTALISPFHHRVTIVCGRKTTASEVVQIALAKCGKSELDHKCHSLALVSPRSTESLARYLGSEDRVMAVKTEAAASVMFVLCVYSPGPAILEIVNSIQQNPAYGTAFDLRTRGYLVTMVMGEGTGRRGKQNSGDHRNWCVLDGSSLLCFRDEEDEGVKQFESFVDVKNSSVSPLSGKKSTMVRVGTADGGEFIFSTSDKTDMLRWIEAIATASQLEPSTMLLHSGGGVVIQTGFLDCQEFALESNDSSPLQSPPAINQRLGTSADISGNYSAVDYGRHWTVLKSSGLIQCLVRGRPEILFSLPNATKVKVHNPRKMTEGAHYYISLHDKTSRVVLQAECPSDHFDWVVSIERVLEERGLQNLLCGDRGKQSGYVTLKRLMMMQEGGKLGDRGSAMQLYAMPRLLNTLDDVYELPGGNLTPRHDYENQRSSPPLSPPEYVNFVPPPPIPPRTTGVPPLPPKGVLRSLSDGTPGVLNSSPPVTDSDYIVMSPPSLPLTPSSAPPSHVTCSPCFIPITPNRAHPRLIPGSQASQPITIPSSHVTGKLLRSYSEASSNSAHNCSLPPDIQDWSSPSSSHFSRQSSAPHSLPRHTSTSSSHSFTSSLHHQQMSLVGAAHEESSGYSSPQQSPGVGVVKKEALPHPVSQVVSDPLSGQSEGYHSSHSSADNVVQPLPTGWRKGYCDSKTFFVNTETGCTSWSLQEVLATSSHDKTDKATQPGGRWQLVTLEDGQVYYYNEVTRQTTWNVQDTF